MGILRNWPVPSSTILWRERLRPVREPCREPWQGLPPHSYRTARCFLPAACRLDRIVRSSTTQQRTVLALREAWRADVSFSLLRSFLMGRSLSLADGMLELS